MQAQRVQNTRHMHRLPARKHAIRYHGPEGPIAPHPY